MAWTAKYKLNFIWTFERQYYEISKENFVLKIKNCYYIVRANGIVIKNIEMELFQIIPYYLKVQRKYDQNYSIEIEGRSMYEFISNFSKLKNRLYIKIALDIIVLLKELLDINKNEKNIPISNI